MTAQAPRGIQVEYAPRVEGEGGLDIVVSGAEITRLRLKVFEYPRHPQAVVVGQPIAEVPAVVARLCGSCAAAHHLAALQALEDALGLSPSPQTRALRRLLALAQWIQSHAIHIYLLAAPALLGYRSTCALASAHPEVVQRALRLKKLGAELTAAVGGRRTAPLAARINGFSPLPTLAALERLHARLARARADATDTVALVSGLSLPSFSRATEHVALRAPEQYPVSEGRLRSTAGLDVAARDYLAQLCAQPAPGSGSYLFTLADRGSFLVGPLARVNLNRDRLCPAAAQAAQSCSVVFPTFNPFASVVARAVELVQAIEECLRLLERLNPVSEEDGYTVRAGEGISVTEAPRGTLVHRYVIDSEGRVRAAAVLTPTAQSLRCLAEDLCALAPQVADWPEEDRKLRLELLVRSYDLCGACCSELPGETVPSFVGRKG